MGVTGDIDRLNALRNTRSRLFPENLKRSMPEWTGKNRQGWLRTFLVDMDKNAGLHVELESDRLGVTMSPKDKRARQLRRAPSNSKPTSASMYLLLALGFGRRIREMRGAAGSVPVIGS